MRSFDLSGNIVDIVQARIYPGTLQVREGKIQNISPGRTRSDAFILPGLIDAHIHIESSLLPPSEFARLAVMQGTVAAVCDPHEIGNVLGIEGVNFMLRNAAQVPFKFYFGAPSCVPATPFETAGAEISAREVEELFRNPDIKFLAEVMNVPAVLAGDPALGRKLELARKYDRKIDGHAPGLRGTDAARYIAAGISTDHECTRHQEAREKLERGMKIQIRNGSAAQDFDELVTLIADFSDQCMFCSDDKHPDDLLAGHINSLVKRALETGYDRIAVLRCATLNPVLHYGLDVGLLQPGDWADFIVIDNFEGFRILKTVIKGELVAENGSSRLESVPLEVVNRFHTPEKKTADFLVLPGPGNLRVIGVEDGQLITAQQSTKPKLAAGRVVSDPASDVLKIAVVNRYQDQPPALGFVRNFGLQRGAIASSVAHDSHNIVVVGVDDEDICEAVNLIIQQQGGLSAVNGDRREILPLPVAGIMSAGDGFTVAADYARLDRIAKEFGSTLEAPYMTLSFMALLVIPEIKLSDRGLFDSRSFQFMPLFTEEAQV